MHPPTCRIDLFTVPTAAVGRAIARMATDRRRVRAAGPEFWKLLGTGDGRTFDVRDADLRRWGLLTVWRSGDDAAEFARVAPVVPAWLRMADEHWWALLSPVHVTGRWSGREPFRPAAAAPSGAPIAVITRARLRWTRARRFWRAVPPVNADLARADGLRLRMGIGEAPAGLQGTFSVWSSMEAMRTFAYRGTPHRDVMRRSAAERWYAEELFARFAVVDHGGTVFGADPLRY